jgi:hypothetical protein
LARLLVLLFVLTAIWRAAGAPARAAPPHIALGVGQFAEVPGTDVECGAISDSHYTTLVGITCYEKGSPGAVLPFARNTYLVILRLDGVTQLWHVRKSGGIPVPDSLVFSDPPHVAGLNLELGHDNRPSSRIGIPLGAGFELGQTALHCSVTTLGIAAPHERGVACAFAMPAGTPRPNSTGIALSDLAAYVAFIDASGHVNVGLIRRQPRP